MARFLSQALIRASASSPATSTFINGQSPAAAFGLSSRISIHRNRSNQSGKAQLIEIELDSDGDTEVMGIRKLEDAIHGIIVRLSAPDWLPFLPGSSYWVPPMPSRPGDVIGMVGKFANPLPAAEVDTRSASSVRGWPSSAYFIEGNSSVHQVPVDMELDMEVAGQSNSEKASQSEDEG